MQTILFAIYNMLATTSVWAAAPQDNNYSDQPGINLSIQSIYLILQGLVCWASRIILIIIVFMLIWYGLMFLMSRDSPDKFKKAKQSLGYGIIGIIVVLGSYTIISTIGNTIEGAGRVGNPSAQSSTNWVNFVIPLDCSAVQ